MIQKNIFRILLLVMVAVTLIFSTGLTQLSTQTSQPAAERAQITDEPGVVQTAIVPETGGTTDGGSGSWILWLVLGIAVIALIAAIASGRATRTDV